jgi:TolB-like protein/AraC-like DNA-binding protein/Tfp pilus assembly protein PilF
MAEPLTKDQAFVDRLSKIVLANLQNENFGVDELARLAGLSRSVIHRKLRTIRRQNITRFIREIRLKRAMELLKQNAGPASDVAFKVGFGSPAYFNKCFHEYYGYPPGEVKKMFPKEEGETSVPVTEDTVESRDLEAEGKASPFFRIKRRRRLTIILTASFIAVIALAWVLINNSYHNSRNLSIVVLPFKNFSGDISNQYIADGIMEDILQDLYQISDLSVRSRTTSEHFRATDLTSKEIARKLNVRYVLESSMRRYGDKTRISVQLIDAFRDNHLWSANYDRELKDILTIQRDIALQVADKLNAVLTDSEIRMIQELPTQNPVAYDYYLRGRFLLNKANDEQRSDIDRDGLIGSIQFFEKAVAADTNFAEAYAGEAASYLGLAGWGWMPQAEGFLKARDLSLKALKINPECAAAHSVKGAFHVWGERRFEEGRRELLTALQLNPNYAPAHQAYAQLLMITGPMDEARAHMDRSLELEPYYWVINNLNAWIYYFEEKYQKAIEACFVAQDLKPGYIITDWLFFLNYAKLGEGEKAADELKIITRLSAGSDLYDDEITEAYKKSGIKGLFKWLVDININRPVPGLGMSGHPFFTAWWYAILGNKEQSVYWLQKNMEASQKLFFYFNMIATIPDFDILRNDPRFLSIIDQIGLAPYHKRPAK